MEVRLSVRQVKQSPYFLLVGILQTCPGYSMCVHMCIKASSVSRAHFSLSLSVYRLVSAGCQWPELKIIKTCKDDLVDVKRAVTMMDLFNLS